MKNDKAYLLLLPIQLLFSVFLLGQPTKKLIDVQVTPTVNDWTYDLNEEVEFEIKILKNGQLIPNIKIGYEIGPEQMPFREKKEDILLETGQITVNGGTLKQAGFLRCNAWLEYEGKIYYGWGTAGFAPDKIQPTVQMPDDFNAFWDTAKEELAAIPMDAIVTLKPELCTSELNVYHVSLQNLQMPHSWMGTSRFYGMLTVPKAPGKYPAILGVPGAGVRAYGRDDRATDGVIVFKVGIHGIPVDLDPEIYNNLSTGALSGYQFFNLEDKDDYYYKRVYMGCIRAIDFIHSLPEFNGENLGIKGGSQGGALSIIISALDDRVDYLAAIYPALSDLTGYLEGRAGGWPHMYKHFNAEENPNWVTTTSYYDVVNFSRQLSIPGWYSWGFNDNVCPPTSMYAAYNSITAPKKLELYLETGHWSYPEQWRDATQWLYDKLGVE